MAKQVLADDDDIDDVMNWATEAEDGGRSAYPSMTYEQGVKETLLWLFEGEESPKNE